MHFYQISYSVLLSLLSLAAPSRCASSPSSDTSSSSNDVPSPQQAGLGIELECSGLLLYSASCTEEQTEDANGKVLAGRKGTNWELTVDVTPAGKGQCNPEYVLDGTKIKLGKSMAAPAAKAVAADLV